MKNMERMIYKLPFVLLLSLISYSSIYSQTENYRFPDSTFYSKAKIYFENNKRFEVSNLVINRDRLTFTRNNKRDHYQLDEIYIVKVQKGTHAGRYALYSGFAFGLSAVLAIARVESDPVVESQVNNGALIGGAALGGALIGALVGSTQPIWKVVFVNEETTSIISNKTYIFVSAHRKYLGLNHD